MEPMPGDKLVFTDLEKALDAAPGSLMFDRPRFFPLGAHPATYRDRYMVDALRRIRAIAAATPGEQPHAGQTGEAITYHVRKIVEFEAGELEAQARYLREWAEHHDGQ